MNAKSRCSRSNSGFSGFTAMPEGEPGHIHYICHISGLYLAIAGDTHPAWRYFGADREIGVPKAHTEMRCSREEAHQCRGRLRAKGRYLGCIIDAELLRQLTLELIEGLATDFEHWISIGHHMRQEFLVPIKDTMKRAISGENTVHRGLLQGGPPLVRGDRVVKNTFAPARARVSSVQWDSVGEETCTARPPIGKKPRVQPHHGWERGMSDS
jgi:hypothetical protein